MCSYLLSLKLQWVASSTFRYPASKVATPHRHLPLSLTTVGHCHLYSSLPCVLGLCSVSCLPSPLCRWFHQWEYHQQASGQADQALCVPLSPAQRTAGKPWFHWHWHIRHKDYLARWAITLGLLEQDLGCRCADL